MNYAKHTHDCLVGAIRAMTPTDNSRKPGTYFTRNRKFSFEDVILHLISSGRGSINEEVRKYSIANGRDVCEAPSKSAVCQQRNKLSAEALPHLFHAFNDCFDTELFHGFQLLAVDGSELSFHSRQLDWDAYIRSDRGKKGHYAVHVTAVYDLMTRKYVDALIQPSRLKNEHEAVCQWAAGCRSERKRLLLADRGFSSYNFYVHAGNNGLDFLVRLPKNQAEAILGKEASSSLGETFDTTVTRYLVRTRRKSGYLHPEEPENYRIIATGTQFDFLEAGKPGEIAVTLRIVKILLDDGSCEYLATTLDASRFPPEKLKRLYRLRWGIETSFLHLKHTIGCEYFHSCKREQIQQEIWARMILYNFCMEIARHVEIKKQGTLKYVYRINVTQAMKVCHEFLMATAAARECMNVEAWILKSDAVPIRDGRHYKRTSLSHGPKPLNYK